MSQLVGNQCETPSARLWNTIFGKVTRWASQPPERNDRKSTVSPFVGLVPIAIEILDELEKSFDSEAFQIIRHDAELVICNDIDELAESVVVRGTPLRHWVLACVAMIAEEYVWSRNNRSQQGDVGPHLDEGDFLSIRDLIVDELTRVGKIDHDSGPTQATLCPDNVTSVTNVNNSSMKLSPEDMGIGLAIVCLAFLKTSNEGDGNPLAEMIRETANNPRDHAKFQLELSALAFVSFRVAIELFGPEDKTTRLRVFEGFDSKSRQTLNQQFLELTGRRGPCYGKCIRENLESEYFGSLLTTRFDQFCRGCENFGHEPLIVHDVLEAHAHGVAAIATLRAVFDMCQSVFDKNRLV